MELIELEKEYGKLARLIYRIQNINPEVFRDWDNKQIENARIVMQKIGSKYQNEPKLIQSS